MAQCWVHTETILNYTFLNCYVFRYLLKVHIFFCLLSDSRWQLAPVALPFSDSGHLSASHCQPPRACSYAAWRAATHRGGTNLLSLRGNALSPTDSLSLSSQPAYEQKKKKNTSALSIQNGRHQDEQSEVQLFSKKATPVPLRWPKEVTAFICRTSK